MPNIEPNIRYARSVSEYWIGIDCIWHMALLIYDAWSLVNK